MARLRVRGIAAAADGDTSDVIAGGEEEEPKPRALRRPAAEHANASAHLLPVEEATGATALGRSEREEAPRLEAREEDDAEIGRGIVFKKNVNLQKLEHKHKRFRCFSSSALPRARKASLVCFFLPWRSEVALGASR